MRWPRETDCRVDCKAVQGLRRWGLLEHQEPAGHSGDDQEEQAQDLFEIIIKNRLLEQLRERPSFKTLIKPPGGQGFWGEKSHFNVLGEGDPAGIRYREADDQKGQLQRQEQELEEVYKRPISANLPRGAEGRKDQVKDKQGG